MKQTPVKINLAQSDLWDDTLLIKKYDESLKLAREEVAKRIARSTNTASDSITESDASERRDDDPDALPHYKIGDFVRSTFSEDGVDYEARIVAIDEDQCTVKYLGYGNEETVEVSSLIRSWGKKERAGQVERAAAIQQDVDEDAITQKTGKNKKVNKRVANNSNTFQRYRSSMMIPPPPPLPPHMDELSEDSEHLSAMLMSWYMSGYYTGLYQGRQSAAASHKN